MTAKTGRYDGDCFSTAVHLAIEQVDLVVVHGIVTGPAGTVGEVPHWHAWCEQDGIVIDRSNGHDVRLPAAVYYQAGKVTDTWRYSAFEAAAMATENNSYGPWVEGYEEMAS